MPGGRPGMKAEVSNNQADTTNAENQPRKSRVAGPPKGGLLETKRFD